MPITPSSRNNRHLILFNVAPYHFCAPAAEVESMIMVSPVSRLPLAPPSVIGLINHRGQVYRVISLRRKLGLETGPPLPQGQLILTNLSTGPTAFLVDDVVDVLPDTHLSRHPLNAHSPMDLFDAFMLHNEQVLFHTTFTRLEQAEEIPYPSPDLETMKRRADDVRAQTPAPDRSSAEQQHRKGETSEKFTLMVERPAAKATAPSPPFPQQTPAAIDEIVHQVVPGDTLWDIAAHHLDDPLQYAELARLSQISNPDLIYPGDIIHIIRKER